MEAGAQRLERSSTGLYLLLVPLEVWDEDKAIRRVRVLKNNSVSFGLLVKNIIHPLEGEKESVYKLALADWAFQEQWSCYKRLQTQNHWFWKTLHFYHS